MFLHRLSFIVILIPLFLSLINCSSQSLALESDIGLYQSAMVNYYDNTFQTSAQDFEKIINDYPESEYVNFAILGLADAQLSSDINNNIIQSENYYRYFVNLPSKNPFTSYAISRLFNVSVKKSEQWFFQYYLSSDKGVADFEKIINDHYKFYVFYIDSVYLKDTEIYFNLAKEIVAEHEFKIGNWYYEQKLYGSAILRYTYLLKNFPDFASNEEAFSKLISSYHLNNQSEIAKEFEDSIEILYNPISENSYE